MEHFVWLLILSSASIIALAGAYQCPSGQFGQDCEYLCNCQACNQVTGVCAGPCEPGYQDGNGRPCQKHNVALRKPSNFTPGAAQIPGSADDIVDGDRTNTCVDTIPGFSYVNWTVELGLNYAISSIFIQLNDGVRTRMRNFDVSVYLENSTWYTCYQHAGLEVDLTYLVGCHVTGSVVRVANSRIGAPSQPSTTDAYLDLCEVEVYECSNGTFGDDCSRLCHCQSGRCDRNSGVCLDTGQECRPGWIPPNCDTACELGMYGAHCALPCGHCHADEPCDHVTGACANGCTAGWQDAENGCHTVCDLGTYGPNCLQKCGRCKNDAHCNPKTGACANGCQEGFTGAICLEVMEAKDSSSGKGAIPTAGVVGAVAGGGVLLMCCVCLAAQIRKKRRKNRSKYKNQAVSTNGIDPAVLNPFAAASAAAAKAGERRKSSIFSGRKKSLLSERKSSVFGGERKKSIFAAVFGFAKDEDLSGIPVYSNSTFLGNCEEGLFTSDKDAGVPIDTFRQYVYGKRRGVSSLENEFKSLPTGFTAAYDESEKIENREKNRYSGFYPYDFNRVSLRQWGHGDYVNASYIKDYKGRDVYIAAQAPCKKTVSDFWHLIWQENVRKIVMVTNFGENGKAKCDRYWSENGCVTYDDITIKDSSQTFRATYVVRTLFLVHKKTSESREVKHFQYTEWHENTIPPVHDLLEFIWRVRAAPTEVTGPLLVHCSTGSGRTGTYIAVDSLLQQAEETGRLDVKTYVERLRHQRKNMVATKEQYAFVHAALIDGIILGDTRATSSEFCHGFRRQGEQLRLGYRQIGEQFQELSYLKSAMAFRRDSGIENITDLKNMSCNGITMQFVPSTLSANMFRLVDADNDTDVQKFMFVLRDINAMTVVCLHEQDYQVITRCLEWTQKKEAEMEIKRKEREEKAASAGEESEEEEEDDFYRMQALSSSELCPGVATKQYRVFLDQYEEVDLEVMSLDGWTQGQNLFPPTLTPAIIRMTDHISKRQSELGFHPVVILIGEVQESAGLFCVLSNIGHAIQQDDEVEVYSNVCRVRRLMPDIVTTMEEFMFCHEFAANYVETHKIDFVL